ncbi:MAG: amidase [Pseudomonadota bacterium]
MDPCLSDAAHLTAAIAEGSLDARDLMAATYDRIDTLNGDMNALVSLLPRAEAMAQATNPAPGPLSGLPVAIKDLANAAGFPTSMGSPIFANQGPAQEDDIFVARMRAAGAIIIGKTNTPEFGLGSHTYNPVHGVTRNPYDLSRSAGGSSGGATAALTTGMVALADGSDMMGSLRNPAGWSNTYGLRPSFGLVPSEPRGDTFLHQLATIGPMARSPRDVELLLHVMAGPDPRQPHGRRLHDTPRPRRLAWLGDWGGAYPTDPGVMELCAAALPLFADLGCEVAAIAPPFDREALWEAWITLRSWMVAASLDAAMAQPSQRARLKPEAIWEAERGARLSALDVHRASVTRSQWFERAARLFEDYDAILMPTAQCFPFAANIDWPKEIGGVAMDTYHRWMEITVPVNLLGLPSLAMPAGFSDEGLPMGLQLVGSRGADLGLLKLAQDWHGAAQWVSRRPPLLAASASS